MTLRNFLVQGVGGRILKLLSDLDIKVSIVFNIFLEKLISKLLFLEYNECKRAQQHTNKYFSNDYLGL